MKKTILNQMKLIFPSNSENESLARICISGFVIKLDITPEELADIKTAVSEAVTNCIVHAYKTEPGYITLEAKYRSDGNIYITITDKGCGIPDIALAMTPFYTTDKDSERCGMGFSIMKSFMNSLKVKSAPGKGTRVSMRKKLGMIK
ncbi:MAG: anti-sigma F factor [Oscillospiraceae bacterium]|nr:anti-sigma F factor [Oscillospiraceae bacterium]